MAHKCSCWLAFDHPWWFLLELKATRILPGKGEVDSPAANPPVDEDGGVDGGIETFRELHWKGLGRRRR